jgi:hypothetical protein
MFSYKAQEELDLMGFAKLECSNAGLRPEEKVELLDSETSLFYYLI